MQPVNLLLSIFLGGLGIDRMANGCVRQGLEKLFLGFIPIVGPPLQGVWWLTDVGTAALSSDGYMGCRGKKGARKSTRKRSQIGEQQQGEESEGPDYEKTDELQAHQKHGVRRRKKKKKANGDDDDGDDDDDDEDRKKELKEKMKKHYGHAKAKVKEHYSRAKKQAKAHFKSLKHKYRSHRRRGGNRRTRKK